MISKFNKKLALVIVVVALLPVLPSLIAVLSPVAVLILVFAGIAGFSPLRRFAFGIVGGIADIVSSILTGLGRGLGLSLGWLFTGGEKSAKFMGRFEQARLLGRRNQGILIDGKSSRLSENASYESVLIQGGMGRGKTSTYVVPNLLLPPAHLPSFVVTDTSGEIYQNTSGYLERRGYQVRVLNLMDPSRSETYNPLAKAKSPQQIAELAKTLVRSSSGRSGQMANDPFWEQAAEKLIRIMAQCLHNQPDAQYRNLANLRHLITGFDAHVAPNGQLGKIDDFVLAATRSDQSTYQAYKAFVQGNLKTIQSVLMSADVAMDPVATPEMAALTATNSFDFDELRQQPAVIYVVVNQTQMELYAFLLNLFYADLFRSLLRNQKNPGKPVYLFLDEFGHLSIPGFEVFGTTARKYKVAFTLFLQSMAQLDSRYGALGARTIQEALATEIYLPGMALDTARSLEARLGRTAKAPLMAANDLIRMKDNEALLLQSNNLPVILKTKRYFQRADLRRRSSLSPAQLPNAPGGQPPVIKL
ncbi:type IV secretory system conjugative DNA transfer family protein [Cohaesibacter gelatinilyticus]|uniref:Type IV secretory pathway, VirD4 component, TraG/TraD family ATPase n=1 Tax=Cohaesibacter gelatinilyticus TaxID=372072 RepID=A0A285PEB4_9HYPH|nr:type IV secretory system conjugative DNA transfer family protein [Cohaesibacter gelatinilyticus]SNZ20094.1 Type IV secretory pathway, VirD4 component, TraG/TraD family ATPase [Cohaesibacter gelatinilyticus]